ncbi:YggS family pyridoxal phosphate-dependent enzyme [Candidatus Nephthysia bennettiae]|uniref:YggS family pyridoxal phosphate-dependent enzyme n=1 Tax=Candidatus Nephthysia bennettiae TaxID=3127016 RepID=UPI0030C6E746
MRERVRSAGGDPDRIAIVAVSKGQPAEACQAAVELGLTTLGENRVQEALPKMDRVSGAEWHLVGHLQTNKVRHASRFGLIHSVDSVRLAQALAEHGSPPVLLEVNVSREAQKHGARPEAAVEMALQVGRELDLRGLMAMGPVNAEPGPAFAELRTLRDRAEQRLGRRLPILSMGMSDDLEAAVREGSTMLRLGRALFGDRTL